MSRKITIQTNYNALNASEDHFLPLPDLGTTWKLTSAVFTPDTSLPAHATAYATLTIENGATVIGEVFDTASGAGNDSLVAGTQIAAPIPNDGSVYFDGGVDSITAALIVASTGAADGTLVCSFVEQRSV